LDFSALGALAALAGAAAATGAGAATGAAVFVADFLLEVALMILALEVLVEDMERE
jgi:hypothetical protein